MTPGMKKCRVCGKEYKACRTSNRGDGVFRWREVACSSECGEIYLMEIRESRKSAKAKPELTSKKKTTKAKPSLTAYEGEIFEDSSVVKVFAGDASEAWDALVEHKTEQC